MSHSCKASCDGAVPSSPIPPVVYGLRSGNRRLSKQRLRDRRGRQFRQFQYLFTRAETATPDKHRHFFPAVNQIGGLPERSPCGTG